MVSSDNSSIAPLVGMGGVYQTYFDQAECKSLWGVFHLSYFSGIDVKFSRELNAILHVSD